MIYNMDCGTYLDKCLENKQRYALVFADPPDNLGLKYATYDDNKPPQEYYGWLESLIHKSLKISDTLWLSYYWKHDLELKYILRNLKKFQYPAHDVKTFFWRFTFGQYNPFDCGSGFRFLVRVKRNTTPI